MKNIIGWRKVSQRRAAFKRRVVRQRVWKSLNIIVAVTTLLNVSAVGLFLAPKAAGAAAIWTTTGSCGAPQNSNHYQIGDHIYINYSGFTAGDEDWTITGKPGGASGDPNIEVASGTETIDSSGAGCFDAYTVAGDDWGEYQVKFAGVKGDNYRVEGVNVGSIILTKVVDSGTASNDDFSFTIDPDPQSAGTVSTISGTYVFEGLDEDIYTITEVPMDGYHQVSNTCEDVEVVAGQQAACEIHNARDMGEVTIDKVIRNEQNGSAVPANWTFTLHPTQGGSDITGIPHNTPTSVPTGSYTVTEQGPSQYSFITAFGDCSLDDNVYLEVTVDGSVTCTFVNETYAAHGRKFNDLNGNHEWGQDESPLNGWTMFIDSNLNAALDQGEPSIQTQNHDGQDGWYWFNNLAAGTYQICEVSQAGWSQTYPQTANGCHTVTVDQPQQTDSCAVIDQTNSVSTPSLCNFGNVRDIGTVTVNKNYDDNGDGQIDRTNPAGWTWDVTSGSQDNAGGSSLTLPTGDYVLTEDAETGYTSVWSCSNQASGSDTSVELMLGKNGSVTCTYTNTKPAVTIQSVPNLSITKVNSVVTFANPGTTVTYTIVVKNTGNGVATSVDLTDVLPSGFTFTGGASTMTFNLGDIAPGDSVTKTYVVGISASQAAGVYTNTAKADGTNTSPVSASSNVEVRVPVVLAAVNPDLDITKTVNPTVTNPGLVVSYTVTITNSGEGAATNVVVTDELPAGFTYVDGGGSTKTWTFATLAAGGKEVMTYDVLVGDDVTAGVYLNRAFVVADGIDPIVAQAAVEVRVPQVLGLATTGAGPRDYATFGLGIMILALGFIGLKRLRLDPEAEPTKE